MMSSHGSKGRDARGRLLHRVDAVLVSGALEQTRVATPWIDLSLHLRADLSPMRAGWIDDMPSGFDRIWHAFQASRGRLVVLGPPGAGKTVMALELVSDALMQARTGRVEPIPILLDLVEWRQRFGIDRWVLEGLRDHYGVPFRFGVEMLERNHVLLIADDLDAIPEFERPACVAQLAALGQVRPELGAVVLARTAEYEGLPARLPWPTVEIVPPALSQVSRYAKLVGLGKGDVSRVRDSTRPVTPELLRLLAIAGPNMTRDDGRGTSPPSPPIVVRALRRGLDGREDGLASETLAGWIAMELRDRRWWAASLDRLASTGPSRPALRRAQRALIVGTTTVVGIVVGLLVAVVVDAARAVVPPAGTTLIGASLLGAAVAVADVAVTDAALFGSQDSELPGHLRVPRRGRARAWSIRIAIIAASVAGSLGLWTVLGEPSTIVVAGALLGALTGASSRRIPWRDSVRWSWRSFSRKLLTRLVMAALASVALLPWTGRSRALLGALGLGIGLAVTSALVAGFKRRVAPFPEREPALATRSARVALGGVAVVLAAGTGTGVIASTITAMGSDGSEPARWLATGCLVALMAGLTSTGLAAALYGGLERLERGALASVLVFSGIARRPVGRRLGELCDGMLLRSAGAGVAFIHRPVMEMLADSPAARVTSSGPDGDQRLPGDPLVHTPPVSR